MYHFREEQQLHRPSLKIKSKRTTEYRQHSPPELLGFCSAIRNTVMHSTQRAFSRSIGRQSEWSNRAGFVNFTLSWLRSKQLVALPTDKDGSFAIVPVQHIAAITSAKLVPNARIPKIGRASEFLHSTKCKNSDLRNSCISM